MSLNKAATSNTTVDVAVSHGETNGSDFTGLVDQTVFSIAGSTGATVTLTLDADDGVEPAGTFVATLSNADGLTIGDGSGSGTVLNGDGPVLDLVDTEVEDDELVIAFIEQAVPGSIDDGTALGPILDDDVAAPALSGSGTGGDTDSPADATPTTSVTDLNAGIGEQAAVLDGEPACDQSTRSIGLLLVVAGLGIVAVSWVVARRVRENEEEHGVVVLDGSLDATMHG